MRPRGHHPKFLPEYATRERARNRFLAFGGFSLLRIAILLWSRFRALRATVLVFATLEFA